MNNALWGLSLVLIGFLVGETSAAPAPFPQSHTRGARIRFVAMPWKQAFACLADLSGKPIIAIVCPEGTFTFIGPPGVRLTPRLLFEAMKRPLLDAGYELIDRKRNLTLVPANELIDP